MNSLILTPQPPYLGTTLGGGGGFKTWLAYCGHYAMLQPSLRATFLFYMGPLTSGRVPGFISG